MNTLSLFLFRSNVDKDETQQQQTTSNSSKQPIRQTNLIHNFPLT